VYFSDGQADPAFGTYTLIGNISYMKPQFVWIDTTFNIPYTSSSGYIAFRYKTIGAAWATYNIDSVTIKPDPSTVSVREYASINTKIGPNPFSEVTTLTFGKPVKNAELCIYSVSGMLARRLEDVNGIQIQVEKGDLPPGVYFYKVSQGDQQLAKGKMVITQ
jgi:hypothetical protein